MIRVRAGQDGGNRIQEGIPGPGQLSDPTGRLRAIPGRPAAGEGVQINGEHHDHCRWQQHQRCAAEDIDPATLGTFDLVLFLGVFYHLRSPIQVLDRIRRVTTGTLILETHALVPAFHENYPLVSFFPGDGLEAGLEYEFSAEPTLEALRQMLRSSGFPTVDIKHTPSMRWLKKVKAAITTRPESGRASIHAR